MSPSDVLLGEVQMLRCLRRHRADRAERALREAKRAQRALLAHIQQAQDALEHTRQEQARQSAELLSQHQGQLLTLAGLKYWNAQERSLSASTRREEGQLEALCNQRQEKEHHVGSAQRQATECLRQVEKLQELSLLLAQEPT
ncbi:YscO family type III secretion system apparatus protein [Pseudomonas paralactis]|uniref:YscO family type III secretion system apparatus protein n=1 Tax=Pseudomonas paralactis TaxID=1615673 RepID=A0ABS0UZP2_9PSED|nr:YscO family type III secretion system apparatus protein [Pseudomonas paralactis]MBI6633508.1 YscO family type III secretion system apparatus protein [Pseudomonas paralactis]